MTTFLLPFEIGKSPSPCGAEEFVPACNPNLLTSIDHAQVSAETHLLALA